MAKMKPTVTNTPTHVCAESLRQAGVYGGLGPVFRGTLQTDRKSTNKKCRSSFCCVVKVTLWLQKIEISSALQLGLIVLGKEPELSRSRTKRPIFIKHVANYNMLRNNDLLIILLFASTLIRARNSLYTSITAPYIP